MILLLYFTVLFYCERWYVHSGGWAGTSIINFSFFFFFFFFPDSYSTQIYALHLQYSTPAICKLRLYTSTV
jgi:hypothetical protein